MSRHRAVSVPPRPWDLPCLWRFVGGCRRWLLRRGAFTAFVSEWFRSSGNLVADRSPWERLTQITPGVQGLRLVTNDLRMSEVLSDATIWFDSSRTTTGVHVVSFGVWDTQCVPPRQGESFLCRSTWLRLVGSCSQETVVVCLLELTHEAFESITLLGLVSPTYCFRDNTRTLSSAAMTFLLEQSLVNEVGSMVLEEVLPLSSSGADAPEPAVSERVQALEGNVSRGTGRRGGRGGGTRGPRQREQKVWTVCSHRFSRTSAPWDLALPRWKVDESNRRPLSTWMQLKRLNFLRVPAKAPAEGSPIARARFQAGEGSRQFRLFEQSTCRALLCFGFTGG